MYCKSAYDMQIDEYIKLYSSIFFLISMLICSNTN